MIQTDEERRARNATPAMCRRTYSGTGATK
jgi:hypothetical protein